MSRSDGYWDRVFGPRHQEQDIEGQAWAGRRLGGLERRIPTCVPPLVAKPATSSTIHQHSQMSNYENW